MDRLSYDRSNGRNILTMWKTIRSNNPPKPHRPPHSSQGPVVLLSET